MVPCVAGDATRAVLANGCPIARGRRGTGACCGTAWRVYRGIRGPIDGRIDRPIAHGTVPWWVGGRTVGAPAVAAGAAPATGAAAGAPAASAAPTATAGSGASATTAAPAATSSRAAGSSCRRRLGSVDRGSIVGARTGRASRSDGPTGACSTARAASRGPTGARSGRAAGCRTRVLTRAGIQGRSLAVPCTRVTPSPGKTAPVGTADVSHERHRADDSQKATRHTMSN
jgi:hypothetical protein